MMSGELEARSMRGSSIVTTMVLVVTALVGGAQSSGADVQSGGSVLAAGVAGKKGDYHNGTFGQAAKEFCTSTATYTPGRHIRTKIVRSTDGWSNTISSRYRKFKDCTAYQMSSKVWCTTRLVDGFSKMCITPRPKARGSSPCRQQRLDVRGVYHPKSGVLEITCVNRY
jgi:hypothetical protein